MKPDHPSEELIRRRKSAQNYYAAKYQSRSKQEAEDFGSYCMVQWLSGRFIKTDLNWLAIDFLRTFTYTGNPKRPGVEDAMARASGVIRNPENIKALHASAESADIQAFLHGDMIRKMDFTPIERVIMLLYYEKGEFAKDIGDLLGLTESRICQLRTEAVNKMKIVQRVSKGK